MRRGGRRASVPRSTTRADLAASDAPHGRSSRVITMTLLEDFTLQAEQCTAAATHTVAATVTITVSVTSTVTFYRNCCSGSSRREIFQMPPNHNNCQEHH
eukprot:351138-Chlamydomonas_euryale.AAC.6